MSNDSLIPKSEKLNFTTKLAYGAGDLGSAITANILVFYFLPFLTNVAGLPAALAGSVLMIGKIADAINDPLIGIWSDNTRSVWGRRLPWMFLGGVPLSLFFALNWVVPSFSTEATVQHWALFAYYVLIGVAFNVFFTVVNLPYTALTPELTQDYNERTNLNSFRFTFSIGGSIFSLLLALVIFKLYPDQPIQQFLYLGIICALLSVLPVYWCVLSLQERGFQPILNPSAKKLVGSIFLALGILGGIYGFWYLLTYGFNSLDLLSLSSLVLFPFFMAAGLTLQYVHPEPHLLSPRSSNQTEQPSIPFVQQLKIVFANRPFLFVIGIYLCSWLGVQLTASIIIFFVINWMKLTAFDSSLVALAVQGTALLMLFVWQYISTLIGKQAVYIIGTGIWVVAQMGLFIVQPGQSALLYVLAVLAGFGVSVAYLIPWSMIPDVIELDELNTGQRREGIFYGFMVLLQKFGLALGLFMIGLILDAAGFISSTGTEVSPVQPPTALWAIRLAIGPVPMLFLIIGCVLAYFYPITKAVHQEIRLKLLQREQEKA